MFKCIVRAPTNRRATMAEINELAAEIDYLRPKVEADEAWQRDHGYYGRSWDKDYHAMKSRLDLVESLYIDKLREKALKTIEFSEDFQAELETAIGLKSAGMLSGD